MKLQTEFLPLRDGTKICAPSNITLMTSFVLREQGDWFEDEIRFVRKFVSPNMAALDIGANYGLYSNAIAKKLGPKGRLWCFEPTPNTAQALRATVKQNKYKCRVKVIEAGLSDQSGTATFYMSPNAELNSLEPIEGEFTQQQSIELTTLDQFQSDHSLARLDFIKLDAEGEELKILQGGQKFFQQHKPLVMFELMHVDKVNHALIDEFQSLGYALYYLIPGLNVLAPFDLSRGYDRFLLNLFAVHEAEVSRLREQGTLVDKVDSASGERVSEEGQGEQISLQSDVLAQPASGLKLSDESSEHADVLAKLVRARNKSLDMQIRFDALSAAYSNVMAYDFTQASPELMASSARVSFDIGEREFAIRILEQFISRYVKQGLLPEVTEPHAVPLKVLESDPLSNDPKVNLCAIMVDAYIRMVQRSGYFAGNMLAPYFNVLKQLGALSEELAHREKISLARAAAMRSAR